VGVNYVGDFNADGGGDFLVSAFTHPSGGNRRGRAYLYFGGSLLDNTPDLVFQGKEDRGMFGSARTPAADLNGDGWPDLVIGAELGSGFEPFAGAVSIYFVGPHADAVADLVLRGERTGDGFGMFTSSMADADGDGIVDLLVGAPWVDAPGKDRVGSAYLFLGGPHMDGVPDLIVRGTEKEGVLGWSGCVIPGAQGSPGQLLLAARSAMRPYSGQGAIELYSLAYWHVLPPSAADEWRPGGRAKLRWRGPRKTDVALSTDSGATWRTVAHAAGGGAENAIRVAVPADVAGPVRVRLTLAGHRDRGAVEREIRLGN
jgi:FG-GAP repeat protein